MLFIKVIFSNINGWNIIRFYIHSILPFSMNQHDLFCFSEFLTVSPDLGSKKIVDCRHIHPYSWAIGSRSGYKIAALFPVADGNNLGSSNLRLCSWPNTQPELQASVKPQFKNLFSTAFYQFSKGNRFYPNNDFLAATLWTCLVCATPYSSDDDPSVSLGQASQV